MNNRISLFSILLLCISCFSACKKQEGCTDMIAANYDINAEKSCAECCIYKGPIVFWTNTASYGTISVTIDGNQRTIVSPQTSEPPCLSTNGAYFYLDLGTYTYSASAQIGGKTWNGTVSAITGCNRILLN
jgi:hypothetical protein